MKKFRIILLLLLCIIPIGVKGLVEEYEDKLHDVVNVEVEEGKINLYLFRGEGCPHCREEEEWLDSIKNKYKDYLNIYDFEVWYSKENQEKYMQATEVLEFQTNSIPFTIVGDKKFVGFSNTIKDNIENAIKYYIGEDINKNTMKLPILGKVNVKEASIPLIAIILGFIDGFNPCAMWILLFLINLFINFKDKKKGWILGFTFLLVSALVYFLSMLGINMVINIVAVNWIKYAIAIFILVAGLLNLRKYIKTRKEDAGCAVVDDTKRKKIITRMKKIMNSKNFLFALIGIILLAISVNLIELTCSLGFPMIFTEILSINNIKGIARIIYLLIYIFFYMIDDLFVFTISMFTLEATGITNKYNKLCTLVSSIIMILMGTLLLIKPEWLMLNF